MALMTIFVALWSTLVLAPDTPIGRALNHVLVARPAAALDRMTRGHVLVVLLLLAVCMLLLWAAGTDGLKVLAMAVPETATWLGTFEITAYVDALVSIAGAVAAVRFEAGQRRFVTVVMPRIMLRKARPRAMRVRCGDRAKSANDDERRTPMRRAS